jgi:hypothetical protein
MFLALFLFLFQNLFCYEKIFFTKDQVVFGDGDTFALNIDDKEIQIRFLGVDTPERQGDIFTKDQYLGLEASEFTKQQIQNAKSLYYVPFKNDKYGRTLAFVFVDDELLSLKIINVGLGYETVSFYKNKYPKADDSEFSKWDEKVRLAAQEVGTPNFQNPFYWRQKNKLIDLK